MWLQQLAEAQFRLRNSHLTKLNIHHYVVAALDQATALRVIDVKIEDPLRLMKNDNQKRRLTNLSGLPWRRLEICLHSMGDRRVVTDNGRDAGTPRFAQAMQAF